MTLKDCTKQELIEICERITMFAGDEVLRHALYEIQIERDNKRLEESDKLAKIAHEYSDKLKEILSPYSGKSISSIPNDVLEKAAEYEKKHNAAIKKSLKLLEVKL